jgi:hypothetical protein
MNDNVSKIKIYENRWINWYIRKMLQLKRWVMEETK